MSEKKEHIVNYDLIRVIAMFLVIAVHSNPKPFESFPVLNSVFYTVTYTCNGLFFMLSGALNLSKTFKKVDDYIHFYCSRAISILLPFVAGSVLLTIVTYPEDIRLVPLLKSCIVDIMGGNSGGYLWFIYVLLGLLLSTPFLSKMLNNMEDVELHLLAALGLCWNIVSILFCNNIGYSFGFSGWLLASWTYLFFLGYYLKRVLSEQYLKMLCCVGIFSFCANILGIYIGGDGYKYAYDLTPAQVLFTAALFGLMLRGVRIQSDRTVKVLQVIATHSFSVYILHRHVKKYLSHIVAGIDSTLLEYMAHFILTAVISIVLAVIMDRIILFPIQRMLKGKLLK